MQTNTITLNTNINCGNCLKSVKPALDELLGNNWSVDTENPQKVLTATAPENITPSVIIQAIESRGFTAKLA